MGQRGEQLLEAINQVESIKHTNQPRMLVGICIYVTYL